MSGPADPVRNPRRNLRSGDPATAFMCQASFSAATQSPTAVASSLIRPPPYYISMTRKDYPDRKLLALPIFKNCHSALIPKTKATDVVSFAKPIQNEFKRLPPFCRHFSAATQFE